MATDLSRLRELLERIWKHCEPILPDHPGPGEHVRIFPDFKQTLGKWGPSCATVSSALEGSAKWCERLKRPEDAKWLRAANTRLNKLWDSTFANLTPEVRKMLVQPLEGETIQQFADGRMCIPWLERANDYSGNNLCKHIRRVGCYARQLLHLLEAVEVREKVDGEADGGTRRTRQEVAERKERLRQQGEKFTSQSKLGEQLGCSPSAIMVNDLLNEPRISLTDLAKQEGVNCCTTWRWTTRGVKSIRLETFSLGGRRYTTLPAFQRFCLSVTAAEQGTIVTSSETPQQRQREIKRAERQATELGI